MMWTDFHDLLFSTSPIIISMCRETANFPSWLVVDDDEKKKRRKVALLTVLFQQTFHYFGIILPKKNLKIYYREAPL